MRWYHDTLSVRIILQSVLQLHCFNVHAHPHTLQYQSELMAITNSSATTVSTVRWQYSMNSVYVIMNSVYTIYTTYKQCSIYTVRTHPT
jgi:hypothetical protein